MAFPCAASELLPVSLPGPALGCTFMWGAQTVGVGPRQWTKNVSLISIGASHLFCSLSYSRDCFPLGQNMMIKPTEWKDINLDIPHLSFWVPKLRCWTLPVIHGEELPPFQRASPTLYGKNRQTNQIENQKVGAAKASGDCKTEGGCACWGLHWCSAQCFALEVTEMKICCHCLSY